jgi:hypothetical protein
MNSPGLMVWAAIWSKGIVGPFFFDEHVTARSYVAMLNTFFLPKLSSLCVTDPYFMHDGAPAHFALLTRNWLDEHFHNRWLGRRGPVEWPPRSPDLTPPDFFLWGVLKDKVYVHKPQCLEELRQHIISAFAEISDELCARVCRSVPSRLCECIDANGGHLP